MQRLIYSSLAITVATSLFSSSVVAEEKKTDGKKEEKITFVDHVLPIFRARCGSCHNANDRKGGLAVDQYALLMEGGSSGSVIEAGDASFSYLYMLVNHEDTPKMPPNADKLPDKELAMIKKWIDLGALENSGSTANIKAKPKLAKIEVSGSRPENVAMPSSYLGDPAHLPPGRNAVTALATSPWAPLTAVSGFKQVSIYNTKTMELMGVLPYPEGQVEAMQFSRNGDLLMVAGGRGGSLGTVVVFDVRTGERKAEVGGEYDTVLGADISPDQTLITLGGPKKMIRTFTTSGELVYENKKHTDWVMSAAFSLDGVLMASGDRAGGLIVWEAETGRLFYDLIGHKGSINSISWRPDSNVVASGSGDGTIKLWDMNNGNLIKSWNAHGGGVASIEYTREGNIVSTGRDKVTRLWKGDGGKIKDFKAFSDIGMEVTYDDESKRIIAGDWTGMLTVWNEDGTEVGKIDTNPPTVAMQIQTLDQQIAAAKTDLTNKTNALNGLKKKITDREAAAKRAQAAHAESAKAFEAAKAARTNADKVANDNIANVKKTDAAVKDLASKAKAAQDALNAANQKVSQAKTAVDQAQKQLTQAMAAEKAATDALNKASQTAKDLVAKAAPTEEEKKTIETDEAVKKAVADRKTAADAAQKAVEPVKKALAAATAKREQQAKDLAAKQAALTAMMKAQVVATKGQADAKVALDKANATHTAAQETLKHSQAQQATATKAQQVAQDNMNKAKAANDKAFKDAVPTSDEQKAIAAADAAMKAAQQQVAELQDRLKRLQATQSQLATAANAK